jgi:hypothetical protein
MVYITGLLLLLLLLPSGIGKTKLAHQLAGYLPDLISLQKGFLLGYSHQGKNVIWDEFRDLHCDFTLFLQLTDKYPNIVNLKGSAVPFFTNLLIITYTS